MKIHEKSCLKMHNTNTKYLYNLLIHKNTYTTEKFSNKRIHDTQKLIDVKTIIQIDTYEIKIVSRHFL